MKDLLDITGELLTFPAFLAKYNISCESNVFYKVCKEIPRSLIQLIQNTLLYSQVKISLPKVKVNEYSLIDFKCNNKHINKALRHLLYHGYDKTSFKTWYTLDTQSTQSKAHVSFIKWSISPKVKETHFKIINNIYPVGQLLKKRFKFEVDLCAFCNQEDETVRHLFVDCSHSQDFWKEVRNWINLKMHIPPLEMLHILLYMDNLDSSSTNVINIVLLLAKYHIHCCKWRGTTPSFPCFLNEFRRYYSSLVTLKNWKSARITSHNISRLLLF